MQNVLHSGHRNILITHQAAVMTSISKKATISLSVTVRHQKRKQLHRTGSEITMKYAAIIRQSVTAHLYSTVAPVCDNDVPIAVDRYTCGGIELPIPLAVGPELEKELPISTEHLGNQHW